MELVLTIIAGFGILLFLIGYLGFVAAGFKHHFVTGLISLFPVLNVVTIPALWHDASKKLLISMLGVLITGASWFFGADKGINKTLVMLKGNSAKEQVVAYSNNTNTSITSVASSPMKQDSNQGKVLIPAYKKRSIDESKMEGLPGKALYRMTFETIPVNKISTLNGRIVQITTIHNEQLEGRIKKLSTSSVFIQANSNKVVENELPIANIKHLRLMVKKAINR